MTAVSTVTSTDAPPLLANAAGPTTLWARAVSVWSYRELLLNLVRRELKVKYKDSILGFLWTLMNPLLYMAVFSFVFSVILRSGTPNFGLLLLSGLLVFNLFSNGLRAATTSITGNGPLVQKVWFPREILPLAAIGAELVTFFFQLVILMLGLAAFGQAPEWSMLWLTLPALLAVLLLVTGLGLLLAGLNVHFRDVEHFLDIALLMWFWLTPVVYTYDLVARLLIDNYGAAAERLTVLNPVLPMVVTFQRVLYNPTNFGAEQQEQFDLMLRSTWWYVQNLGISLGVGVVVLIIGFRVFTRVEGDLGEAL
ncbi:MAG: ABC transporter permease [Actinomycetota bacterium]